MTNIATFDEFNSLFANGDPDAAWLKASAIARRINPAYDLSTARTVFDDMVRIFRGEYPGYAAVKTLYHDLHHTLDVFLCAVRLMHGLHVSGVHLSDEEITIVMAAAMLHDIGYAQRIGEESGTGAQYTKGHVGRGIEFARQYFNDHGFPPALAASMELTLLCTDPAVPVSDVRFPDERARLLGQIVGTADLAGQMADRTYLEKLLFLYLEFKEAHFGGFQNISDLLRKTQGFYEFIRKRLDVGLGSTYRMLSLHFKEYYGAENNYYLESIEKNLQYLSRIVEYNTGTELSMLKRGGIVEKSQALMSPEDLT